MNQKNLKKPPKTLFITPHGSMLYGLSHEGSDIDIFRVISDNPTIKGTYAKQHITETDQHTYDETVTDLSTFMLYASRGIPQFLEAMWSQQASVDEIQDLRYSFRPDYYQTQDTYSRTITNFWGRTDLKSIRHAYRLTLNLMDFLENGMFNPTLSTSQQKVLHDMLLEHRDPLEYLT